MRKSYTKPEITFDSFALTTDITASCSMSATFDPNTCPVYYPDWGVTFFSDGTCDAYPPGGLDFICYHVPAGDRNVFIS